ncbi:hypothetical protein TNCV_364541 [Trichonephila clavipes]|uniref:Uncharacterized protein n=1 Tax=Trichonephila clavipes TaxID=2585209 RepID=A0A8X6VCF0_TRICX|nr:hypothetical protein TNCV_364541 [Trichonephila clavipes]
MGENCGNVPARIKAVLKNFLESFARIRFVPVYTTSRHFAGSKCRSTFRTLFRLGTLGVKSGVFSNSPMASGKWHVSYGVPVPK